MKPENFSSSAKLVNQFHKHVDKADAEVTVASLRTGKEILVPGTYAFNLLMKFGFGDEVAKPRPVSNHFLLPAPSAEKAET
jgi:hypothetical protein